MGKGCDLNDMSNSKLGDLNNTWSLLARLNWLLSPPMFLLVIGFGVWTTQSLRTQSEQIAVINEWRTGRMAEWVRVETIDKAQDARIEDLRGLWTAKATLDAATFATVNAKLDMVLDMMRKHIDMQVKP
jgi:hypothetical protein